MVQKMLVALDGSKTSESILRYAEGILSRLDADLTLVRVTDGESPGEDSGARTYLRKIAHGLAEKGAVINVNVLHGEPAVEIAKYAKEGKFEFVLMCTRGYTGLRRMVLGSVAEEVLRLSSIPVFVTHPLGKDASPTPIRRIVVPLDGSHRSATVLKPASELAEASDSYIHLVTVVAPTGKEPLPVETVSNNLFRDRNQLEDKGIHADVTILYGDPAHEILTFADRREADMIAISTHGRTGLSRLRYGSVAERILRQSKKPLLVVRTAAKPKLAVTRATALRARHRALETVRSASRVESHSPFNG